MQDYISITMNGQRVGLKFGNQSFIDFQKKAETVPCWTTVEIDGKNQDSLTEVGCASVLYYGYVNNCYCRGELPTTDFSYFYEFVEPCFTDKNKMNEILMPVINCWLGVISDRYLTSKK